MVRWIAYAAALLATVYAALLYHSVSLLFLAGVELLPLFLFLLLFVQRPLLKVGFVEQRMIFLPQQEQTFSLAAVNRSAIPIRRLHLSLRLYNQTTKAVRREKHSFAVGRRRARLKVQEAELEYGIWQVAVRSIHMYDLLHFFSLRKWKRFQMELVCLPRRYEMKGIRKGERESWEEKAELDFSLSGRDVSVLRQIRDYRPGDRMADIHWKLSAKREELQVKEYGQVKEEPLLFGIDTTGLTKESMELIYSLLRSCIGAGIDLRVVWKEKSGQQRECNAWTAEEADWVMELLMRSPPGPFFVSGRPASPADGLWVEEGAASFDTSAACGLRLRGVSGEMWEISRAHLEKQLTEMELTL